MVDMDDDFYNDDFEDDDDLNFEDDYDDDDYFDELPFDPEDDDPYEDGDPDPDPEEDRYSVWVEAQGDYVSVWEVSRLTRWRRFIQYDWQQKVAGPFFRLRHRIGRHFRRCAYCGKMGCGPYYFSNTCSDACAASWVGMRAVNRSKLHIQSPKDKNHALCGEVTNGIYAMAGRIRTAEWIPGASDEFCTTCVKRMK